MISISPQGEIIYSDVNIQLGTTSSYELLYNEDCIRSSILNILSTRKGSRPFRRNFGSNVLDLVFDPLDEITAKRIQLRLKTDILAYETRIQITELEVLPDYEQDSYYVSIVGVMPALANRSVNLNFNINRSAS